MLYVLATVCVTFDSLARNERYFGNGALREFVHRRNVN